VTATRPRTSPARLLQQISSNLPTMRKSESKVGDVVLREPAVVVGSTVASLARAAAVSEPTVIRFCASLGFDGFQAFRMHLAQAMALGLPISHSAIRVDDSVTALTAKIFDHSIHALDQARTGLDAKAMTTAVQAILHASEVLFVGLGASGVIAQDAQQKFALFARPCTAPMDPHQQYIAAATSGPETVVVAISNTGRTSTIIEVARQARARGAVVIAMTGAAGPLSAESDIVLIVNTDEDTNLYTPTVSRLAGLVVIDVLATSVALAMGDEHLTDLQHMKEGLALFRANDREHAADPADGNYSAPTMENP
jgi:RpiR family transcriptional regulator, carbohydrate utilization regulator